MVLTAGSSPTIRTETVPFINETFGANTANNSSASGNPTLIHDGGDNAAWTPVATQGIWNFASLNQAFDGLASVCVELANNLDTASFSGASIDGNDFTSVSFAIFLQSYSPLLNDISMQFTNGGTPIGNPVNIDLHINTALIGGWQNTNILLIEFGVDALVFDGFQIIVERVSGVKPTIYFDVIQVEEFAGMDDFVVSAQPETDFRVEKLRFYIVNGVIGGAAREYDDLLGVTLPNGILVKRFTRGVQTIGEPLRSVSDFYAFGFNRTLLDDDGVNSYIILDIDFPTPVLLEGDFDDKIVITIQDDISDYLFGSVAAIGTVEDV